MEMVCSILKFLDASPARLLDDLSGDDPSRNLFKSFLLCVLSAEPSVRRLATGVADRLFKGHLEAYRKFETGHHFGTHQLRGELWAKR
jgi:neurofibromin 1